ncbi:hypothetical protein COZ82_01035 [Candidatus Kaiserbacteria bacterium CG_4_8_14_3_um_filter_38_9]|uniref:ROK family protein n=1 Tax=Candidatus Kaiserbacteria bacterium CG_4_8_14_3_um_filter_38_9 TaxID=1974599 RepID=A0A2M7IPM0_9BACT|nr:MAG: hypothetical protein COZ82_01035 [Candidatus Kaiserbacteria bacterium CG_4_8_14_3_um_filter_38_9]
MSFLLFDIGGTKSRLALTNDFKTFSKVDTFKTFNNPAQMLDKISDFVQQFTKNKSLSGIVGGIRGVLDEEKCALSHDAILTSWVGFNLVEKLAKKFKITVILENDTALAGLGETWFGAGQGVDLVAYHSISTGVGGVKITSGFIDETSAGFEPGHQILDIDRTILGSDISPTLENLVSGRAVEERTGIKPYDIPADDVIWNELAEYLAQGLRNTILYWSPEIIILGGSMMIGDPKIPLEVVRKETVKVLDEVVASPFITLAKLGDEAGLYGAMVLAKQRIKTTK